jgi:hypothetical protein
MPNGPHGIEIRFEEAELVVDLRQLGLIQAKLDYISVESEVVDPNPALRLARLKLRNVEVPAGYSDDAADTRLDLLISYLRNSIREEFGGWTPVIGKNRLVGAVVGSPYTGGGIDRPYTGGSDGAPTSSAGAASGERHGMQPRSALPIRRASPRKHIRAGILDTRFFMHPDLTGRYLASEYTLVPPAQVAEVIARPVGDPSRVTLAHATFIAGVILRWAPDADLIVDHVLNEHAQSASSWDVATKMAGFAETGVDVLNISFGAATFDNQPPLVLQRAVEVLAPTVTVVAAVGNNAPDLTPIWPAALDGVVSVGAGEPTPAGAFESAKFSPHAAWVDLIAPGEDIYSTYEATGYATWRGTSFAAAAVSGAIADLMETKRITAEAAVAWLLTPPDKRDKSGTRAHMDYIGPRRSQG